MEIGNFIKITNGPKSPAPKAPSPVKAASNPQPIVKFSNKQLIGIGLILFGFVLIGVAVATW